MGPIDINFALFASEFVPDCYGLYRPLVSEGLVFFFDQLSEPRRQAIIAEQMGLPTDTPVPARLVRVLHHCPALHKLGQVLARRRELDPGLRSALQQLETLSPRMPMEILRPQLEAELRPAMGPYGIQLGSVALAEGSVAAVVPFSWRRPKDSPGRADRAAVAKVLKPGVVALLEEDLAILGRLADMLEETADHLRLPPLQYREIFDDVRELLAHEVQTRHEQANLVEARRQLAHAGDLIVPELLPFSTHKLTAMDRIDGVSVTDCQVPMSHRRKLARTLVDRLLADVLLSRGPQTLFHGDPHAGNLLATPDGRLAVLDWSLVGHLRKEQCERLIQVLMAATTRNVGRAADAVAMLAEQAPDRDRLLHAVGSALAAGAPGFPPLPTPRWLLGLLDRLSECGVHFPPELLLFRRACFMLEGVVADVDAGLSVDSALTTAAITSLIAEWPLRFMKMPDSRDFSTHFSLLDLFAWMASSLLIPS